MMVESPHLYVVIYVNSSFAVLYVCLFVHAAYYFFSHKPIIQLTWIKFYNAFSMAASLLRVAYFLLSEFPSIKDGNGVFLLRTLPTFLYISAVLIVPFVYGIVYSDRRLHSMPQETRGFLVGVNIMIYLVITVLYPTQPLDSLSAQEKMIVYFSACLFLLSGVVCFLYTVYTYSENTEKRSVNNVYIRKLAAGKILTILCFGLRAVLSLVETMQIFYLNWYYDSIFFFVLDFLPLTVIQIVVNRLSHSYEKTHGVEPDIKEKDDITETLFP